MVNEKQVRAAAEVIHNAGVRYGWIGPSYTQTYLELEKKDPIGFDEFNDLIHDALMAAEKER
jgi:hypothetical protein